MSTKPLRKTHLHDWHVAAGARMTDFGGWDMPVQYPTGPREEHLRVRAAAGLFDIDHMGRFEVAGTGALDYLQSVQTWDLSSLEPGRAHYSLLCSPLGGVVDDIFIYRLPVSASAAQWLIVVNAVNRDKDFAWLTGLLSGFDARLRDASSESCMAALQGPLARGILQGLADFDLAALGYHRVTRCSVGGTPCTICTTGYTGEPGYELLIPSARAETLWNSLIEAGAARGLIPCGLAARDSLRAEACFPLYGHEMNDTTDPFSVGLGKAAVRMDGHDFIGKPALAALSGRPRERKLVGFEMTEPAVPRQGYPIMVSGRGIGAVSTGLFGPSTARYVGMGYVESAYAGIGQRIDIVIRGVPKAARVVERPFYRSPHWSLTKGGRA